MQYYIYILTCSNDAFYTGYTTDIKRRYSEHLNGSKKCKYTRSFPPKQLTACWQLKAGLSEVLKIERAIKQCSKAEKQMIIESKTNLFDILCKQGIEKAMLLKLEAVVFDEIFRTTQVVY